MSARKADGSSVEDWVKPLTIGGRWGRVSSSNKEMVDVSAVRDDFAPSFRAEFGIELEDMWPGGDPPDITARIGTRLISVELVELMHDAVREKKANGLPVSFDEQQWNEEQLIAKLNFLLDKKEAKYARRADGFRTDALLIVSCELWMSRTSVADWLSRTTFRPRSTIGSAYFGIEGLPNNPTPHFPLHCLYGVLGAGCASN